HKKIANPIPVTPSHRRSNPESWVMAVLRPDCFGLRPRKDEGRIGCNSSYDLLFFNALFT
ncbi:MAG: hypothetical protein LBC49_04040, partial [Bacteroidales bacterium]|nr:hypothetical protein [Bacteroidales bacterium]